MDTNTAKQIKQTLDSLVREVRLLREHLQKQNQPVAETLPGPEEVLPLNPIAKLEELMETGVDIDALLPRD